MTSHHDVAARLRATLGGIAQEECGGDNLAILLASYFEPGIESEELDDSGTWKQGAIDACDKVLDAIHAHYTTLLESQAKALSEAELVCASVKQQNGHLRELLTAAEARALAAEARLADVKRELTPSGETKSAHIGEYHFEIEMLDEDGETILRRIAVPWTTIKEIMAAIAARAFTNAAKEKTNAS